MNELVESFAFRKRCNYVVFSPDEQRGHSDSSCILAQVLLDDFEKRFGQRSRRDIVTARNIVELFPQIQVPASGKRFQKNFAEFRNIHKKIVLHLFSVSNS